MSDSECLFCRIARREVPADVLRETARIVAFRDINPQAPTHIVLIPKEHLESLVDIEEGDGDLLVDLVQSAAHLAHTEGLTEGWRLVSNVGPHAGQSVFHLHFHLIGGRPMGWPPG